MKPNDRFHTIKDDFRNPFGRDRDRIIHSSSFRRLEQKTQVFINNEGDYFRSRLTHSLEVSQFSRAVSRELKLNEDLAEAISLAHDLGHPPFGHTGEYELDKLMKKNGSINGFEHNYQSFRILSKLEKRYKDIDGLNLTFATLEGVLKHSPPYNKPFFNKNLDKNFKLDTHPSFEAMIVDKCDTAAYSTHDIDDGLKSGLISWEILLESKLVKEIYNKTRKEIDIKDTLFKYKFLGNMINKLIYSLLDSAKTYLQDKDTSKIASATIDAKTPAIDWDDEMKEEITELKALMLKKLYRHTEINRSRYFAKICIQNIFKALMEDTSLLPDNIQKEVEKNRENKLRLIADFIASMSDRYATKFNNMLYTQKNDSF